MATDIKNTYLGAGEFASNVEYKDGLFSSEQAFPGDDGSYKINGKVYYPALSDSTVAAQLLSKNAAATVNKMITAGDFDDTVLWRLSTLINNGDLRAMEVIARYADVVAKSPMFQKELLARAMK